jgi:hypothetical protein
MRLCQAACEGLVLCVRSYQFLICWYSFMGARVMEGNLKELYLRKDSHMFVMFFWKTWGVLKLEGSEGVTFLQFNPVSACLSPLAFW